MYGHRPITHNAIAQPLKPKRDRPITHTKNTIASSTNDRLTTHTKMRSPLKKIFYISQTKLIIV
jgi:hypothetical protein